MTPLATQATLALLFERLKKVGFLERLFGWKQIQTLSFEAYGEYQQLRQQREAFDLRLAELEADREQLQAQRSELQSRIAQHDAEMGYLKGQIHQQEQVLHDREQALQRQAQALDQHQARITELRGEIATLTSEAQALGQRLQAREKDLERLSTQREHDGLQRNDLQTELARLGSSQQLLQEELAQRNNQISALKESERQQQEQLLQLKQELATQQGKIDSLQQSLQHKESERGQLSGGTDKLEQQLQALQLDIALAQERHQQLTQQLQTQEKELGRLQESDHKHLQRVQALEQEKAVQAQQIEHLQQEYTRAKEALAGHQEREEQRLQDYDRKISGLEALRAQLDHDRKALQAEREREAEQQRERQRLTWRSHEERVQQVLKDLAQRHTIEYLDREQLPFKGKPDNTLKIANEYVIFDAKSPQGEDLSNFPKYIRTQAEQLKKYASQEGVKRDLFLVVPTNTSEVIGPTCYALSDYRVFVVTLDALEPIILSLQRIEAYEFAEQMSPEDRDNICRVLGKFAHATKRKIQVDAFLNGHFLSLLNDCEQLLPEDILAKTAEFERSEKLNPPMEKRAKTISMNETEQHVKRMALETEVRAIPTAEMALLNTVPLSQP
jgi:DNA repair exonuclease SbcCD ATPase subunit